MSTADAVARAGTIARTLTRCERGWDACRASDAVARGHGGDHVTLGGGRGGRRRRARRVRPGVGTDTATRRHAHIPGGRARRHRAVQAHSAAHQPAPAQTHLVRHSRSLVSVVGAGGGGCGDASTKHGRRRGRPAFRRLGGAAGGRRPGQRGSHELGAPQWQWDHRAGSAGRVGGGVGDATEAVRRRPIPREAGDPRWQNRPCGEVACQRRPGPGAVRRRRRPRPPMPPVAAAGRMGWWYRPLGTHVAAGTEARGRRAAVVARLWQGRR